MISDQLPDISVIIPIHNAQKTLSDSLDSLLRQSFRNFEIIAVDDCSSDSSPDILSGYSSDSPSDILIRVLHTEKNSGPGVARNMGIDAANGKYLYFLDADDILQPQALEFLIKTCESQNLDLCFHDWDSGEKPKGRIYPQTRKAKVMNYEEMLKMALYQKREAVSPWGVLVKRDIIGDKRYREGIIYEDLDAFYRFYEHASRIGWLPLKLLYYRISSLSLIHRWNPHRLDVLDVTDRLLEFVINNYPALEGSARSRRFSAHYNILLILYRNRKSSGLSIDDYTLAMERCLKVIREGRGRALRDPNVRIKNKIGALIAYLNPRVTLRILSPFIK